MAQDKLLEGPTNIYNNEKKIALRKYILHKKYCAEAEV